MSRTPFLAASLSYFRWDTRPMDHCSLAALDPGYVQREWRIRASFPYEYISLDGGGSVRFICTDDCDLFNAIWSDSERNDVVSVDSRSAKGRGRCQPSRHRRGRPATTHGFVSAKETDELPGRNEIERCSVQHASKPCFFRSRWRDSATEIGTRSPGSLSLPS